MTTAADFYEQERWTVGIIGLGYVGLPLAVAAVTAGLDVIGYDIFSNVTPEDDLSRFAAAVVLTDHDVIDYADLAARVPVVFDARGTYRRRGLVAENVVPL
jgi:UDP-N-acetyl-D-mannosaminuronate dehydrogenase